jgi:DIS3-like exonuclease 2
MGIAKGYYFEGVIRMNQMNRKKAFVNVKGLKMDVMIDGLMCQNRALDGDTVIIELLPPIRWSQNRSNNVVVNGGKA